MMLLPLDQAKPSSHPLPRKHSDCSTMLSINTQQNPFPSQGHMASLARSSQTRPRSQKLRQIKLVNAMGMNSNRSPVPVYAQQPEENAVSVQLERQPKTLLDRMGLNNQMLLLRLGLPLNPSALRTGESKPSP